MSRNGILPGLAVTAACAVIGFLVGRGIGNRTSHPSANSHPPHVVGESAPSVEEHSLAPLALPNVTAFSTEDFQRFAGELAAAGHVDDDFAQWLGLVLIAREDLNASLKIARREDLLSQWAQGAGLLDPEATVELLLKLPRHESEAPLTALLSALGRTNPTLGLELLQRLPGSARPDAFWFFNSWAERSVSEAATAAAALENEWMRNRALSGVFHTWGIQDRREMLEWAIDQGTALGRHAFRAAYEGPAFRDPELALEFAQEHPEIAPWHMLPVLAEGLVEKGASGWETILALPEGSLRAEMLIRGGEALARKNPEEAWKIFKGLSPGDQRLFLQLSAMELARVAPKETSNLLLRLNSGDTSTRDALTQWAQLDAPAALEWSHANLKGFSQIDAIENIFSAWLEKDAPQAVRALDALPPGARANLLPEAAEKWSANAPSEALKWANSLSDLERTRAVQAVISGWSRRDPMAAAEALDKLPPDGLDRAYDAVARNLAEAKPTEAAGWAESLRSPTHRERAIENVIGQWSRNDAASASEYVSDLRPGSYRDAAIAGFVNSVANLDPVVAAEWADAMDDPLRREISIRRTLPYLKARNPAAARSFVDALSDRALREKMRKLLE